MMTDDDDPWTLPQSDNCNLS